ATFTRSSPESVWRRCSDTADLLAGWKPSTRRRKTRFKEEPAPLDLTIMNKVEPSEEPSFEEALAALEAIVRRLEDNNGSLDEAMAKYEEGVALIRGCQEKLRQAEQRILLLTGIDEDNNPVLRPFEHQATANKARSAKT